MTDDPFTPGDASLSDDVRQLLAEGRSLLSAELAYHKARMGVAGAGARGIAAWGALALALVFFALMALVLGLLLALGSLLGPWAALGIVVAGCVAGALLAALVALRRWRRMARLLSEREPAP